MAVITLLTKGTVMFVIFFMTCKTGGRQSYLFIHRREVTVDTFQLAMLACQFKVGFIVVKIPVFPITGVVTRLTTGTLSAFVHVVNLMARPAVRLRFFKHH